MAVRLALAPRPRQDLVQPGRGEVEVEEAGAGDLDPLEVRGPGPLELVGELGGDLARRQAERLGQLEGDVGGEVAVSRSPSAGSARRRRAARGSRTRRARRGVRRGAGHGSRGVAAAPGALRRSPCPRMVVGRSGRPRGRFRPASGDRRDAGRHRAHSASRYRRVIREPGGRGSDNHERIARRDRPGLDRPRHRVPRARRTRRPLLARRRRRRRRRPGLRAPGAARRPSPAAQRRAGTPRGRARPLPGSAARRPRAHAARCWRSAPLRCATTPGPRHRS